MSGDKHHERGDRRESEVNLRVIGEEVRVRDALKFSSVLGAGQVNRAASSTPIPALSSSLFHLPPNHIAVRRQDQHATGLQRRSTRGGDEVSHSRFHADSSIQHLTGASGSSMILCLNDISPFHQFNALGVCRTVRLGPGFSQWKCPSWRSSRSAHMFAVMNHRRSRCHLFSCLKPEARVWDSFTGSKFTQADDTYTSSIDLQSLLG